MLFLQSTSSHRNTVLPSFKLECIFLSERLVVSSPSIPLFRSLSLSLSLYISLSPSPSPHSLPLSTSLSPLPPSQLHLGLWGDGPARPPLAAVPCRRLRALPAPRGGARGPAGQTAGVRADPHRSGDVQVSEPGLWMASTGRNGWRSRCDDLWHLWWSTESADEREEESPIII